MKPPTTPGNRVSLMSDLSSPTWRPTVAGSHYAVSSGHHLATAAAIRALEAGGNAVDAGVTAAMALAVLQPDVVSFAGVAPTLIFLRAENRVISLAGLGYWPAATDVARLVAEGGHSVPEGILRQVVPAAPAAHIAALREFGTFTFEQAALPAFELARDGFYFYPELRNSIELHGPEIDRYSTNAAIFRPGGHTPPIGANFRQSKLARTIARMMEAERMAGGNRRAKLRAVHDFFYKGPIAKEIVSFHIRNDGFLRAQDLADFEVPIEEPVSCRYRDFELYACDVWCQGIVMLEALKILEKDDLVYFGHNSVEYLHMIVESLNLAFADREAYVGDPTFINVPTAELLSDRYAASQRARINQQRAFGRMPDPGALMQARRASGAQVASPWARVSPAPDTIYAAVVDSSGNAFSVTPSDVMFDTPMVEELGFAVSSRGSQSRLQEDHPCSVAPGKRPRLTPSPALALREGELAMVWGTPGGDVQSSAMLQVFLNVMHFGMTLQQAIEAPRIGTFNFPNSFAPHVYLPGRMCAEVRIDLQTLNRLTALGHDVEIWPDRAWTAGAVCAIVRDPKTGLLHAGADPRRTAYAQAW